MLTVLTQIPCLGWVLALLVASLGLGAVILTRSGTVPYPLVEPAPAGVGLDEDLWAADMAEFDESDLLDEVDDVELPGEREDDTPQ